MFFFVKPPSKRVIFFDFNHHGIFFLLVVVKEGLIFFLAGGDCQGVRVTGWGEGVWDNLGGCLLDEGEPLCLPSGGWQVGGEGHTLLFREYVCCHLVHRLRVGSAHVIERQV